MNVLEQAGEALVLAHEGQQRLAADLAAWARRGVARLLRRVDRSATDGPAATLPR